MSRVVELPTLLPSDYDAAGSLRIAVMKAVTYAEMHPNSAEAISEYFSEVAAYVADAVEDPAPDPDPGDGDGGDD